MYVRYSCQTPTTRSTAYRRRVMCLDPIGQDVEVNVLYRCLQNHGKANRDVTSLFYRCLTRLAWAHCDSVLSCWRRTLSTWYCTISPLNQVLAMLYECMLWRVVMSLFLRWPLGVMIVKLLSLTLPLCRTCTCWADALKYADCRSNFKNDPFISRCTVNICACANHHTVKPWRAWRAAVNHVQCTNQQSLHGNH